MEKGDLKLRVGEGEDNSFYSMEDSDGTNGRWNGKLPNSVARILFRLKVNDDKALQADDRRYV